MMRPFKLIGLFLNYLYALLESNIIVATDVLSPGENSNPELFEIDLETRKNFHIFVLTCMITMTPGTLSLRVNEEKSKLLIHSLYSDNPEQIIASIKKWERTIMEVF